jgi:Ca2+-transporting ATPase
VDANNTYNEAIAHTMGFVTFSLFTLVFSLATKDSRRSVFCLDTFDDRTLNRATIVSVLTLIVSTVLEPLQNFLDTVALSFDQWLICVGLSLVILLVSEIWKGIQRRGTSALAADRSAPAGRPSVG